MSIVRNIVINFGSKILNLALGICLSIISARLLGPEGLGHIAFWGLIPAMLITFSDIGYDLSIVYRFSNNNNEEYKLIILNTFNVIFIFLSVLALIILLVFKKHIFDYNTSTLIIIMIAIMYYINLTQNTLVAYFKSREDYYTPNKMLTISKIILLAISIMLLIFAGEIDYTSVYYIAIVAINSVICVYYYSVNVGFKLVKPKLSMLKPYYSYGFRIYFGAIAGFLILRLDMLMLKYMGTTEELGIYSIAVRLAEMLLLVSAASMVTMPGIIKGEVSKEKIAQIIRYLLFITIMLSIAIAMLAQYLIVPLYGVEYKAVILLMQILLIGISIKSMNYAISPYIMGKGKPEYDSYLGVGIGILNVLLNIVLIPRYGPIGAAVATTISYVAGSITYLIIFMKLTELGIWTCILISRKDFSYLISIFSKQLTLMKNSINSVG